ncbi:helix-turn-helix transcriptional regulator, partial [Halobacterium salinarum]|nr:helix-turn-helix transcriptional regulator [Halobacterium salinarum]
TPSTPSELAADMETSLQNIQYHLDRLEGAALVQECDTRYSSKGREMSVYGARDTPVVLFAGSEEDGESVRAALSGLFGGIGAVSLATVAVQHVGGGGASGVQIGTGAAAQAAPGAATSWDAVWTLMQVARYGLREAVVAGGGLLVVGLGVGAVIAKARAAW